MELFTVNSINIPISDINKNLYIKLTVSGVKKFKIQLFILRTILKLYSYFVPFHLEVKLSDNENFIAILQ